jgi:hypothetical protein
MAGINSFFWLMIIAHLIGDFYLQSKHLACNKKESLRSLLIHNGLYALPFLIVMTPYFGGQWWWCVVSLASIAVTHGAIDLIKIKVCCKYADYEKSIFFADQFLHIAIIYVIASIYAIHNLVVLNGVGNFLLSTNNALATGYSAVSIIKIFCAFLLIFKPANIIIKILKPFSVGQDGQPQTTKNQESNKAGSMIGNLERILILVLLLFNQYTAIAFILTAKSITRYNKIVEDPPFAEYYLIGTLTSVIIAVLASLIAK